MKIFGYNYRITDFQCALGVSQLKKINRYNFERKKLHPFIKKVLKMLIKLKHK